MMDIKAELFLDKEPSRRGKDFPIPHLGTVTVVYSSHKKELPPERLPDRFDGVFLETGDVDYTIYPREVLYVLQGIGEITEPEYRSVFPKAQKIGAPVYFSDPVLKYDLLAQLDLNIPFLEAILGGNLIGKQIIASFKKDAASISRRDFLKLGAKAAVGTWLALPAGSMLLRKLISGDERLEELTAELRKLSHKLHPEELFFLEKLRDTIVAQKIESVMRGLVRQEGNMKHMVRIWGHDHVDFETRIQNLSEERMAFLQSLKAFGILKTFEPSTLYQVVENSFDKRTNSWIPVIYHEVPELKALIS